MNDPESRPIVVIDMRRPAEEYDDPCRPLDSGAAWILLGLGALCGAIWTVFAWTLSEAFR